jgi:hypothetical protein
MLSAQRCVSQRAEMVSPNLDFELAHAEWCGPRWRQQTTRQLGQAPALGSFASAETPKRSSHLWGRPSLHHPDSAMANVTDDKQNIYIDYLCRCAVQ